MIEVLTGKLVNRSVPHISLHHVTRFEPITAVHFDQRYNNIFLRAATGKDIRLAEFCRTCLTQSSRSTALVHYSDVSCPFLINRGANKLAIPTYMGRSIKK